ncbi:MAG: hypothetical protein QXR73_03120, partial [Candidatus Micrarchaeaceae archaeon]
MKLTMLPITLLIGMALLAAFMMPIGHSETANTVNNNGIASTGKPSVSLSLSSNAIDANGIEAFNAIAINATSGNYVYTFQISNASNQSDVFATNAVITNGIATYDWKADATGNLIANVIMTNISQSTPIASNTVNFIVNNVLALNSIVAKYNNITVGSNQIITANISGGTPPYSYDFEVYNENSIVITNSIQTSSASSFFAYTQNAIWGTGKFTADIMINDAAGDSVKGGVTYNAFSSSTTTTTTTTSTTTSTVSTSETTAGSKPRPPTTTTSTSTTTTSTTTTSTTTTSTTTVTSTSTILTYIVGSTTGHASATATPVSLTLSSGYETYFFGYGGSTGSAEKSSIEFSDNWTTTEHDTKTTANGLYLSLQYNMSNIGYIVGKTTGTVSGGIAPINLTLVGVGANVIIGNGAVFDSAGNSTSLSLSYSAVASNSFAIIMLSAGGSTFSTTPTTTAAGCNLAQNISSKATSSAVFICNYMAAGSYTVSASTLSNSAWSAVAYVFPTYSVTLDDSPSTGTITTNGNTYSSGTVMQVIGTNAITANPPSSGNWLFSSWIVSNSINLTVSSPTSNPTTLTVMGNGIITASWNITSKFIETGLPIGTIWNVTYDGILNRSRIIITGTITGFDSPYGVSIAPNGAYAYVTNTGNGAVSIVDTAPKSITGTITGFDSPYGVSIAPNGAYAYVTNVNSTVSIVNTS